MLSVAESLSGVIYSYTYIGMDKLKWPEKRSWRAGGVIKIVGY